MPSPVLTSPPALLRTKFIICSAPGLSLLCSPAVSLCLVQDDRCDKSDQWRPYAGNKENDRHTCTPKPKRVSKRRKQAKRNWESTISSKDGYDQQEDIRCARQGEKNKTKTRPTRLLYPTHTTLSVYAYSTPRHPLAAVPHRSLSTNTLIYDHHNDAVHHPWDVAKQSEQQYYSNKRYTTSTSSTMTVHASPKCPPHPGCRGNNRNEGRTQVVATQSKGTRHRASSDATNARYGYCI